MIFDSETAAPSPTKRGLEPPLIQARGRGAEKDEERVKRDECPAHAERARHAVYPGVLTSLGFAGLFKVLFVGFHIILCHVSRVIIYKKKKTGTEIFRVYFFALYK